MNINRVVQAVYEKRQEEYRKDGRMPEIRVYMNNDSWLDCMSDYDEKDSSEFRELHMHQTILGYKVFRADSHDESTKHPEFDVVVL